MRVACPVNAFNIRQPGDLRILRGVADGVAEEARILGFASLGFPRFALSCSVSIHLSLACCNNDRTTVNGDFGSLADL